MTGSIKEEEGREGKGREGCVFRLAVEARLRLRYYRRHRPEGATKIDKGGGLKGKARADAKRLTRPLPGGKQSDATLSQTHGLSDFTD